MNEGNGLRDVHRRSLRTHAHELIALGYQELHAGDYTNSEEPEITGELVRAMREVQERESAPAWAVYYTIHDDPPLNVPDKRGRKRPRVDIEFERIARGSRLRFRCEAKRLRRNRDVRQYLGEDGLGCFTSVNYPLTHREAGMRGFVQSDGEIAWAARIETALRQAPDTYGIAGNDVWEKNQITLQLSYTYRSRHYCPEFPSPAQQTMMAKVQPIVTRCRGVSTSGV
jgi:hypothetical protein